MTRIVCLVLLGLVPSANAFTLVRKENSSGRRGGAVRYAPSEKAFILWGFLDADPEFPRENPAMRAMNTITRRAG